jgi:hypothetical protein
LLAIGGKSMDFEEYRQVAIKESLSRKNFNKIFCIGYNKTGTTSLELVLSALGYKCPVQEEQEIRIVKQLYEGNFQPLIEFCHQYEAFQDMPFSQGVVYAQVDCLFPNSKFILTVRDPNKWFDSLTRFHLNGILKRQGVESLEHINEATFKNKTVYLYENYSYENAKRQISKVENNRLMHDWSLLYNKDYRIKIYEERNKEIIKYFQNRLDSLLVIDFEQEKDISKILDFLNLPAKLNMQMPHLNRSK